jgi:hypothetical protein
VSYDYMIVRLRTPAACLNDLSPESCVMEDWLEEGRALLCERLPELAWETKNGRLTGDGSHLGTGRLQVTLDRFEGLTQVWVAGSHRSDQTDFVRRVAEAVGGGGFDTQTGKRVE